MVSLYLWNDFIAEAVFILDLSFFRKINPLRSSFLIGEQIDLILRAIELLLTTYICVIYQVRLYFLLLSF